MEWRDVSFDWNQIKALLAVHETGSFSAASICLKQTQPTLSRQIAALEESLGVLLFERNSRKLIITEEGLALIEMASSMRDAAYGLSLKVSEQKNTTYGRVSVSASHALCSYHLPNFVQKIREHAPEISIDVHCSDNTADLIGKQANIAIRHVQPTHPDLVVRQANGVPAALFASQTLAAKYEQALKEQDYKQVPFIGYGSVESALQIFSSVGLSIDEHNIACTSNTGVFGFEAIRAGIGFGLMDRITAKKWPELIEVPLPNGSFTVPTWLVTTRALYSTKRIKFVFDFFAEQLIESKL